MRPIFRQFQLKNIQAPNFLMTPLELKDYIDFEVKRVYFITNPRGTAGGHCHRQEKELFVMLNGSCLVEIDWGEGIKEIKMEGLKTALYISRYVWHFFKEFSPDAVLMALSSTNYDPERKDYIEDYKKYQEVIKTFK
ncbi:hypothetical protein D6821_00200 [Candidatus Parcubacteria bacterium]|nr:MAG: hypothetical protein D6821_00200 [Candidatus Parcubacteria bacterium]